MKQKKKGFTLVELVIVIAVIAILAGVMIAVFANVVNKANESAKLQEARQAELQQKMEDITMKLENQNWLGWEDFENELAQKLSEINVNLPDGAVEAAVTAALNEYGAAKGGDNTGLTEEQIQTIVSRTLAGSMTSAQVEAIVKKYNGGSSLTASQVKQIVDAAMAKSLSAAEVRAVVDAALTSTNANINKIVNDVADIKTNALTEEQIAKIIADYVGATKKTVSTADELKSALADETLAAGSVIVLEDNIKLPSGAGNLMVAKNLTIDVGDYNLAVPRSIIVYGGATLTVKGNNGTISNSNWALFEIGGSTDGSRGNLVIESGNFVGGTSASGLIRSCSNSVVTINGGSFSANDGAIYGVYSAENSTIIINDGTFNLPIPVGANASTAKDENGKNTNVPVNVNSQLIINGGTFNGTLEGEPVVFWSAGNLLIYGGTFTGNNTVFAICGGNVGLYGGTITSTGNVDVSACIYENGTFVDGKSAVVVIAQRLSVGYQITGLMISDNVVISVPTGKQAVAVYETTTKSGEKDDQGYELYEFVNEIDLSTTMVSVNTSAGLKTGEVTLNIADKFK